MKQRLALTVVCLFILTSVALAQNEEALPKTKLLVRRIDYWLAGPPFEMDDQGRRLIWQGTIDGQISGTMKWWFVRPSPAPGITYAGGNVGYYAARWEIWDGVELLLAGESAGKTVTPAGADGMWDGHGVVTEACQRLNALKGRHTYETGPVMNLDPLSGTGLFVIH